jgi:small subunit ribosomal protein S21
MEGYGIDMGKPINVETVVRKGEPIEKAIKRFMRKVKKEKVIEEFLERRFFEKPSAKRNKKNIRIRRKNAQLKKQYKELENR